MSDPIIGEMFAKAHERLESAQALHDIANYDDAISRAYYAILDAARAALVVEKVYPKSHAGTIQKFTEYLIEKS